MSVVTTFYPRPNGAGEKRLEITMYYLRHSFQDITNKGAFFGVEVFSSSVEGFIGMVLSYSLMQLPEIASKGVEFIFCRCYCSEYHH